MEGERQEDDVDRDGSEFNQVDEPKKEEGSQEKRATEEVAEPLFRPLPYEAVEERVAVTPERAEEDAGERASSPSPVPESSAAEVEEPEALSEECEPLAIEAVSSEAADIETEREHETGLGAIGATAGSAPKPPKKKIARKKRTAHKRADGGGKKPARKRARKRSAKKRKKSRA